MCPHKGHYLFIYLFFAQKKLWKTAVCRRKQDIREKNTSAGEVVRFILEFQLLNENNIRCDGALA